MIRGRQKKRPSSDQEEKRYPRHPEKINNPPHRDYRIEQNKDYVTIARALALLGATTEEIAEAFGVEKSTVFDQRERDPEFEEAINQGKILADARVVDSLYHSALGYSHPEDHISVLKDRRTGVIETVITPTTKHYPPNPTSLRYWLNNRRKMKWKSRHTSELSGLDGKPIEHLIKSRKLNLDDFTDDELAQLEGMGVRLDSVIEDEEKE